VKHQHLVNQLSKVFSNLRNIVYNCHHQPKTYSYLLYLWHRLVFANISRFHWLLLLLLRNILQLELYCLVQLRRVVLLQLKVLRVLCLVEYWPMQKQLQYQTKVQTNSYDHTLSKMWFTMKTPKEKLSKEKMSKKKCRKKSVEIKKLEGKNIGKKTSKQFLIERKNIERKKVENFKMSQDKYYYHSLLLFFFSQIVVISSHYCPIK